LFYVLLDLRGWGQSTRVKRVYVWGSRCQGQFTGVNGMGSRCHVEDAGGKVQESNIRVKGVKVWGLSVRVKVPGRVKLTWSNCHIIS